MGSTEDSGPMKPGNSVEDKTLTTGKQREDQGRADAGFGNLEEDPDRRRSLFGGGKSWTRGESDTSGESTQRMGQRAQKTLGGGKFQTDTEAGKPQGSRAVRARRQTPTIPGHLQRKTVTEDVK